MNDKQKLELLVWMLEQIGWTEIKYLWGKMRGLPPSIYPFGHVSSVRSGRKVMCVLPKLTLDLLAEVDRLVFNESSKYSRTIHSCLNRMSSGGNVDGWTVTLYPGSYKFFNIDLKVALSEALYEVMEWAKKEEK